jgi:hypothetical protein
MNDTPSEAPAAADDKREVPIQAILDALRGLRFGSVTVVVQDGVIVQVERVEKKRLGRSPRKD